MRILLDECLPKKLKGEFGGYEVKMVQEMGWSGRKNGALLSVASPAFDVLVTVDQSLRYQQNLDRFEIGVIALRAVSNRIEHLSPLMARVRSALDSIQPKQYIVVSE